MLNLIIYLLEVVSIFLIIHVVFQSRFRWDLAVVVSFSFSICMLFVAYIVQIPYITYMAHIATFIYCLYEFRRSLWETLLRFACSVAIGAILETMFLMEVNSWLQTSSHSLYAYIGINAAMLICSIILYWFFVNKQILFGIDMSDKTFITLVIIINVFVLYIKEDGHGRYLRLIICIISFVLLIARFALITKREKSRNEKTESEWLVHYTKQYEKLIQDVRKRQHDYKNEIQTIKMVCATGDEAVTLDVIKEYEDAEQYTCILNGCENPVIAGLIYSKVREFEEQGVSMTCQIRIKNIRLPLEMREVIDLIGILLDNAFECTIEQDNKTMQLEINQTDKKVSIKASNPSPYISSAEISKMFALGYSTKGKNRGIGLHTVRELVKKYHGDIITGNRTVDGKNYFDIQIIIPFGKSVLID